MSSKSAVTQPSKDFFSKQSCTYLFPGRGGVSKRTFVVALGWRTLSDTFWRGWASGPTPPQGNHKGLHGPLWSFCRGGTLVTIYWVASASLLANSSSNQMWFWLSTRKPSWGWPYGVGILYSEKEPVPLSGKEPKMFCNESSNQTSPLLSTLIPDV
jgi:hypothetical protein